jgi:hypothetical protein
LIAASGEVGLVDVVVEALEAVLWLLEQRSPITRVSVSTAEKGCQNDSVQPIYIALDQARSLGKGREIEKTNR